MKQRDARRKRSRTSPSGTDGFRIPKPGRINDPGDRFSRVERESRAKIRGIRSRWSPPPPFGEVSPFVDSVGEAELYEGTAMGKRKKEQRIRTFRIYIYPVGDVLTCSWGLDSRTRRMVSQRCLSAGRTYKPPSRLSSAAWCCVSLRKKNG